MPFLSLRKNNFNSIKVRLKLAAGFLIIAATAFQFHKGTIKTANARLAQKQNDISIP